MCESRGQNWEEQRWERGHSVLRDTQKISTPEIPVLGPLCSGKALFPIFVHE